MAAYLRIIFLGLGFAFVYNYMAALLRSLGNAVLPLLMLGGAALLNVALDLFFVLVLGLGVPGTALATVLAQGASAAGLSVCCLKWPRSCARSGGTAVSGGISHGGSPAIPS